MLSYFQKRILEQYIENEITSHGSGIDTRLLILHVVTVANGNDIPANRYHIAGLLGYIVDKYSHTWIIKQPGGQSIIS